VQKEVTPFFERPENCSPTSIVLSIHDSPTTTVTFSDIQDGAVKLKRMSIETPDIDSLSDGEVIQAAIKFLDERLASDSGHESAEATQASDEDQEDEDDIEEEVEGTSEDEEEAESTDSAEEIEIGRSMLTSIREKLANGEGITENFIETLRDMLKPALIIDGQHRLFGAAAVEENIPVLACALIKPDWKEQVFQFTVINDKAVGIPKPFITSLAGMSLTASELSDMKVRLQQAGVQLWEVEVMQKLGYDRRSAFFDKIEFKVAGTAGSSSGLGYQTVKRAGKAWYSPKSHGLIEVMRKLYQSENGPKKNQKALRQEWHEHEDWFFFFNLFWDAVKARFGGTKLWTLKSSLMIAVVLEQLQAVFLKYLSSTTGLTIGKITETNASIRRDKVVSEFVNIVNEFLKNFKEKDFIDWPEKSLNHKSGRERLQNYFEKVRQGGPAKF
jgi:hypothetical protein